MVVETRTCIKVVIEFSNNESLLIQNIMNVGSFTDIETVVEALMLSALGYEGGNISLVTGVVNSVWGKRLKEGG